MAGRTLCTGHGFQGSLSFPKLGRRVATKCQTSSSRARSDDSVAAVLDVSRRVTLALPLLSLWDLPSVATELSTYRRVVVTPEIAPDQSKYDPADPDLRAAARLLQDALGAQDVQREEKLWTEIIQKYGDMDKNWVPDLVGRAWGNRGNARSRMGKLDEALLDYNTSIDICPWSVDPVLNRGVVLEALGRFDDAVADYEAVLAVNRKDPGAWNNLGNAYAGMGKYEEAAEYYGRAAGLAPEFAFAKANRSVALFELGREKEAVRNFRTLLRRYPEFPDVRAALVAALWKMGMEGEAETEWLRVEDPRYKDRNWLQNERRWPPSLVNSLDDFLNLRDPNLRVAVGK
ncbi:hypothetical protein BSKO_04003 [Bryopsis sp. KO-2023]|nr:hypothetical protein BSKO_04003 [Bryopsis sp. KO-2023]